MENMLSWACATARDGGASHIYFANLPHLQSEWITSEKCLLIIQKSVIEHRYRKRKEGKGQKGNCGKWAMLACTRENHHCPTWI